MIGTKLGFASTLQATDGDMESDCETVTGENSKHLGWTCVCSFCFVLDSQTSLIKSLVWELLNSIE